jgi:hypothetical protein
MTGEQFEKMMAELKRIGDALEYLAIHADPDFYLPAKGDEKLMRYRRERVKQRQNDPAKLKP